MFLWNWLNTVDNLSQRRQWLSSLARRQYAVQKLYSSWYGVTDLLDGKTSLDLTAKAFSANLGKANGDVSAAFAAYVGASNVQNRLVADRMALYGICKQGSEFGRRFRRAGATDTFPAPTGSPG